MRQLRGLSLALLWAVSTLAQPVFREKVEVTWVEVPVTVAGRDHSPVRGLTEANFEVLENGTKRRIEAFEAIDFAAARVPDAISPLHPASRRRFLLLFDLSFSTPLSVGRAQDAARDFIARGMGSRDLVAVATVDTERGLRFLTAFTTDRELLAAAVADPARFRAFDPLQIASGAAAAYGDVAGTGAVSERRGPVDDSAADFKRTAERLDDIYNRNRVERQVEMLGSAARSLQQLPGRKHVVLLSDGFDPRLVQGRSSGESREQEEENSAIIFGEVWKVDSDRRYGNPAIQKTIRLMAEEFRRADVVLHAIDIKGVRVQNDVRAGAGVNSNEGLFLLANATGGTVFRNSNNVSADFERLARQHEVVYILGFHAPAGRPGELHDLTVRLVNVPGARLQHRGAYRTAGGESMVERTLTTAEIVINDIAQDDIGLAALAAAFPGNGDKAVVPVILEIAGDDLVRHGRNGRATVELFLYAFDDEGLVRDSLYERVQLDLAMVGQRLEASGIRFYGTLALPPATYAVKSLVRVAESDRKGYRRINIEVPAGDDVALVQPLFPVDAGEWVMVKAARDGPATPYPFVVDGQSFIPDASPDLHGDEPRTFTVFVYNAEGDELVWDVSPEATLVSESGGGDRISRVFRLEGVPAGATELAVSVRKNGSSDQRSAAIPIEPR